jgi:hypothetical protein
MMANAAPDSIKLSSSKAHLDLARTLPPSLDSDEVRSTGGAGGGLCRGEGTGPSNFARRFTAMTSLLGNRNPWLRTVLLLEGFCNGKAESRYGPNLIHDKDNRSETLIRKRSRTCSHSNRNDRNKTRDSVIVRIVDRPTRSTAIVDWCDPGSCHYGYQTWRIGRAMTAGCCVLSGRDICKGDPVYRPSRGGSCPQNCNAMILATSMPNEVESDTHSSI